MKQYIADAFTKDVFKGNPADRSRIAASRGNIPLRDKLRY